MHKQEIVDLITGYLSRIMGLPSTHFDLDAPLERYGMDSTATVGLSGELSERLGMDLSPDVVYDHPTISAITDHVLSLAAQRG